MAIIKNTILEEQITLKEQARKFNSLIETIFDMTWEYAT